MAQTYDRIVADANKRISELQAAERNINQEINRIKDKEWAQPLSKQDRADIDDLRAAKSSVLSAMEELAYVTMGALDQTAELLRIKNAIGGVIKDLAGKVKTIQTVANIAAQITKALGGIENLSAKISAVLPK